MKLPVGAATTIGTVALVCVLTGAGTSLPEFVDIAREAGLVFHHTSGASADKHLVETMGSGGLFFDYDGDGRPDIFLVDGGSIADPAADRRARHRLYHNRGNGTFEDVTDRSGIRHLHYGMGACAGDYDGDGRPDLFVTGFGGSTLYHNDGNGVFADTTAAAHVGDSRWSTGCAFADLDGDGDLDLWVTQYVDADRAHSPYCGDRKLGVRFYCHPLEYDPLPNIVYRNDGGGVFTDVSAASGVGRLRSNGLGVVVTDYDGDGRPDVFVANDTMPNFLFHNDGHLRFSEVGLASGMAVGADGRTRAGMGIDTGDYDGDGRLDIAITNLDFEMHTLHRGLDRGLWAYASTESGIGFPTLPFVGFGVAFLDYDNDGRLDLAIADGHILDNAPQFRAGSTYRQRNLLFHNTTGRRFVEVGRTSGSGFSTERVSRGLAVADVDDDGDLDLLVRLRGRPPNTDAIGARVRVVTGARTQFRDLKAGSSYLSQNDLRAHFGLGAASRADRVEVTWPSGRSDVFAGVAANQIVTIEEGRGLTAQAARRRP